MDDRLTTNLMVQTYRGWNGHHNPCNQKYWTSQEFSKIFKEFCQDQGYRPVLPKLAIETYPHTFGVLMEMDDGPPADPPPVSTEAPLSTPRDVPATPLISEPDSDTWATWSVTPKEEEEVTHTMEVDDSAAASAGGPLGDPPAEEAVVVAPHPWQETLRQTWEETAGKVDLRDIQIGFVSTPDILFDQANKLFEAAHREAIGRTK